MRKFLFILASTASLAVIDSARSQYVPYPSDPGYRVAPAQPQYGAPTPGRVAPGYNWREQRAQDDWRNNTWRENLQQDDWRNNNWREKRTNEDWRQREGYAKDRTRNNAIDRGYVECAPDSVVETCRSRSNNRNSPLPAPAKQVRSPETGNEKKQ